MIEQLPITWLILARMVLHGYIICVHGTAEALWLSLGELLVLQILSAFQGESNLLILVTVKII